MMNGCLACLPQNNRIVLMMSGGRKSMLLADILQRTNLKFRVVHLWSTSQKFNLVALYCLHNGVSLSNSLTIEDDEIALIAQNNGPFKLGRIYRPFYNFDENVLAKESDERSLIYI